MIPLYKPYVPEDLAELNDILQSGNLAYGEYGRKFESKLSTYIGTNKVSVVNSYHSAVLVTLTTLGIKSGDEVISSPMACLASNQPFAILGLKISWSDIDPYTGTLCPDDVRNKITSKTKAIFHNHFCGYPGYVDEINSIGKEFGIPVVDDSIEAFGSQYNGNKMGNLGSDVTIFSFQAVRVPTTIDGGAISFKDQNLYELSLKIRDSGIDRKYFRNELGEISESHDIKIPGHGATMSELNSYIGCKQMDAVELILAKQRENATHWKIWLTQYLPNIQVIVNPQNSIPNYWVYGILANNKIEMLKKFRDMGFYASSVHLRNNLYSVFGEKSNLPGVSDFSNKFLALPCGWWFKRSEL